MYAAQKEIAKRVGARHDYDVSVYAATETEPLAAAIEHEKTQPEESPFIEEGGKATRKSKPSIETQAVAHVNSQYQRRRLSRAARLREPLNPPSKRQLNRSWLLLRLRRRSN